MENMAGSMSMPNETKKMAAKASRNGAIFFSMRSMTFVSANTMPMKNAPMSGGTPQKTAKAAERKTTPEHEQHEQLVALHLHQVLDHPGDDEHRQDDEEDEEADHAQRHRADAEVRVHVDHQAAHHGQDDHGDELLHDDHADDVIGLWLVQAAQVHERLHGHGGAGHGDDGGEEDGIDEGPAQGEGEQEADEEVDAHVDEGEDGGRSLDLLDLLHAELQSDEEDEEQKSELGQGGDEVDVLHQAVVLEVPDLEVHEWADENADDDVGQDGALLETVSNGRAYEGYEHDRSELQQQFA